MEELEHEVAEELGADEEEVRIGGGLVAASLLALCFVGYSRARGGGAPGDASELAAVEVDELVGDGAPFDDAMDCPRSARACRARSSTSCIGCAPWRAPRGGGGGGGYSAVRRDLD